MNPSTVEPRGLQMMSLEHFIQLAHDNICWWMYGLLYHYQCESITRWCDHEERTNSIVNHQSCTINSILLLWQISLTPTAWFCILWHDQNEKLYIWFVNSFAQDIWSLLHDWVAAFAVVWSVNLSYRKTNKKHAYYLPLTLSIRTWEN